MTRTRRHPSLAPTSSSWPRVSTSSRRSPPSPHATTGPSGLNGDDRPGRRAVARSTGRARQTTTFSSPRNVNAPGYGRVCARTQSYEVRRACLPVDDPVGRRPLRPGARPRRVLRRSAAPSARAAAERTRGRARRARRRALEQRRRRLVGGDVDHGLADDRAGVGASRPRSRRASRRSGRARRGSPTGSARARGAAGAASGASRRRPRARAR